MVKCAKCGHKWREFPPEDAPITLDEPVVEETPKPEPKEDVASAPEAGMSIEEMTKATKPRPRPKKPERKKRNWLGWLIFLLILGGLGAGAYYGRNFVVQVLPGTASLYQSLKLDVKTTNQLGLEIRNVQNKSVEENGIIRLTVTGEIVNITGEERPIPRIAIQLVDSKNQHVYSWQAKPKAETVGPWEKVEFSSSMNQPPAEAKHIKANLIAPRKAITEDKQ